MTTPTTPVPAAAPQDEATLDELLSRPLPGVGEALAAAGGDVVLLGAGGKIGPTMARMARRALDAVGSSAKVVAVSRFSDQAVADGLRGEGIEVRVADLAEPAGYRDLPDAAALFFLAAMKFGTTGAEDRTWWSNAAIPAMVADRYRGVPSVVYSTGNVYPLTSLSHGGSLETDPPGPVGEYAQSCLARERIFTHAAHTWGTPATIFRLNYACELRYGVVADIAVKIAAGEPVDVTMPAVNVAWQGDVSAWALRSLELAAVGPHILNATGPETVSVRRLATWLAEDMGTEVVFVGAESDDALLNDASECHARYGYPTVPLRRLVRWVAQWVAEGGRQLGKATKFQQREGNF
ncbi:NAD-dependent epimerase/dehydratase family protein [Amycolatopsis taiwanensis]|uniref:Epimerase n=1 Tax=Amycolatopsis taiwanensis TaxID=342230 RepID=A0A9W6VLE5_9PSEU|nr:NAD-dependent epimerase/dehydratase family protein [Amycolatopsis taiwanensis]GLY71559.1 epimerase [Amycolatopsis taiwanensis]